MLTERSPMKKTTVVFAAYLLISTTCCSNSKTEFADYGQFMEQGENALIREGGHLKPNINEIVQSEFKGKGVRFITNSKGFRNSNEFTYEKESNTCRILLMGDSYIDGMRTDQEKTIGYVLERYLNNTKTGPLRFEVMVSGNNNPVNAFYNYQNYTCKYQPDIIIVGLTIGNDINWNTLNYSIFPKDEGGEVVLEYRKEMEERLRDTYNKTRYTSYFPEEAYVPVRSSFAEYIADRELVLRSLCAQYFNFCADMVPPIMFPAPVSRRKVGALDFGAALGLFYIPPLDPVPEMYNNMEFTLKHFHRAAQKNNARFLVVFLPIPIQTQAYAWNRLLKFYSLNPEKFDLRKPNKWLKRFCNDEGIDCFDVTDSMQNQFNSTGRSLYRSRGDMHYNDEGQALVGKELSAYLKKTYPDFQ
jgi:hypothetical protein